jgi:FAD/FMN-containing dehydrogenase
LIADDLDWLGAALEGRLVPAGSRDYERAHKVWNSRFDGSRPAAIAEVVDAEDIRRVIDFARGHGGRIVARNGGHSYGGYSSGDGVIVIDVSRLDTIEVSADARRARIGAGATLLPAYQALSPHRRAIPAGVCPTVGITGLTAGGGLGVLGRLYGLTCDSLTEVELVDAEGKLLRANDEENADLFWALRGGGGGNFGVVVTQTFRLVPVDVPFTHSAIEFPWAAAERVVSCWQEWAHAAPRELWSGAMLETRGRTEEPCVRVETFYGGNPDDVPQLVDDLVAAVEVQPTATTASTSEFATIPSRMYCEGLRPEEWHTEDLDPDGKLPRFAYYAKSDVATRPWRPAAVAALVTAIEKRRGDPLLTPSDFNPPTDAGRIFIETADGAIGSVAGDATAFPHRDALFVSQLESRWRTGSPPELEAPNIAWACELYSALAPSGSCYLGYIDPELEDWEQAYYGANLPRLRQVKATYDPDNFFRFARSIPPAGQRGQAELDDVG